MAAGTLEPLPIDPLLPELALRLRAGRSLVVEAPPGAGKTTRVPRALLELGLAGTGEVVVLEPRRLAARLSARRVAAEMGEPLGERVGYSVRFESVGGPRTRLRFVTQGVLARRLLSDPQLRGVGAVVLDEFHERQIEGDLVLALCARLQHGPRPDLKLVVMSATLEAEPVLSFLGCDRIRAHGQRFEVAIEHREREFEQPFEKSVAAALRRLVREGLEGHVLVFLPGAAEIRRAQEACAQVAAEAGLELVPLHGDLPPAEQDRALAPSARRKVILSTNVAETSLTIDGVVAVVDGGLARIASHAPWSGLPLLRLAKVSRASAAQRAGRAGRTRPGRCLRLYTKHDHDSRPEHELPEIRRVDLAETVLALRAAGVADPARFEWFEPPPPAALAHAETLLARLGAIAADGQLTALGRRMLRFPLHPRQARIVCEAETRGVAAAGCALAALLGERPGRRFGAGPGADRTRALRPESGRSDLLAHLEAVLGSRTPAAQMIERAGRQLLRLCRRSSGDADPRRREQVQEQAGPVEGPAEDALLLALLAGYPDRVARRRAPRRRDVVLACGGAAVLSEASVVRDAELMVAVEAEEKREPGRAGATLMVYAASAIEPEWLLELSPDALHEIEDLRWNPQTERVEAVRRLLYDQLVLEERSGRPTDAAAAGRLLAEAARAAGPAAFLDAEVIERWCARMEVAGLAPPDPARLRSQLAAQCEHRSSFAELRALGPQLLDALLGMDARSRARIDEHAPERVSLAHRMVRLEYRRGQPPRLAARLQDFFGTVQGPRVGGGRIPVVLELLAPNQRAVQVTTDLAGFWNSHYPQLRRELARRYPKHAWPEDPLAARPPAPRRRR